MARRPLALPDRSAADVRRQALSLSLRVLEIAESLGRPSDLCLAHVQVARSLVAIGDVPSGESHMDFALAWAQQIPGVDLQVDVLCEAAELDVKLATALAPKPSRSHPIPADPRCLAALDRAHERAIEAAGLVRRASDPQWEMRTLLRLSDLLDRCGDHEDAAQLQGRALSLLGLAAAHELIDAPPASELLADPWPANTPELLM